jgi:hypothetical protein
MSKIIGDVVGVPNPKSDWSQNDSRKADYIKNKPDLNVYANVLKGNASGEVVAITDISPIEHNMGVKLESKNLFKPTDYTKGTINASTGVVGESDAVKVFCLTTDYIYLKSGAYVVSNIKGANLRYIAFYDLNKGFKSATWTARAKTFKFTITEDCYIRIDIERDANVAIDNFDTFCDEYQFMLEVGTVKTEYTPYIDVNTTTLSATGKNLIKFPYTTKNGATINGVTATVSDDGTIIFNGTATGKQASLGLDMNIKLKKGVSYTLSGCSGGNNFSNASYRLFLQDNTYKQSITVGDGSATIIPNYDSYYLTFLVPVGVTVNNVVIKPMLEVGDTATSYEPYVEPTSYKPNADGTVEGVKSIYPNITLTTDTSGVLVECEYNRDINKAFAELTQAIIAVGGMNNV